MNRRFTGRNCDVYRYLIKGQAHSGETRNFWSFRKVGVLGSNLLQ